MHCRDRRARVNSDWVVPAWMGAVRSTPKPQGGVPAAAVAGAGSACAFAKAEFNAMPAGRQAQNTGRVRHVPLLIAQSLNTIDRDQRAVVHVLGDGEHARARSGVVRKEHFAGVDVSDIIRPRLDVVAAGVWAMIGSSLTPPIRRLHQGWGSGVERAGDSSLQQAGIDRFHADGHVRRQERCRRLVRRSPHQQRQTPSWPRHHPRNAARKIEVRGEILRSLCVEYFECYVGALHDAPQWLELTAMNCVLTAKSYVRDKLEAIENPEPNELSDDAQKHDRAAPVREPVPGAG